MACKFFFSRDGGKSRAGKIAPSYPLEWPLQRIGFDSSRPLTELAKQAISSIVNHFLAYGWRVGNMNSPIWIQQRGKILVS